MTVTINGSAGVTTNSGAVYDSLQRGTAVSASGTSVDFTSIPSWVRRITVMLSGVSLSGTSNYVFQIGAGSIANTGYLSGAASVSTTTSSTTNGSNAVTTYIVTGGYTSTAASVASGHAIFTNISGNTWVATGILYADGAGRMAYFGGNITLSGTLDRVRITTINGTDTFDAGTINIIYE
jgi:hypothetical protein